LSLNTTVYGPVAVTLATYERVVLPGMRLMSRWKVVTTAWALNGVPSLNTIPCRNWIV
jgi:hypothetical protein